MQLARPAATLTLGGREPLTLKLGRHDPGGRHSGGGAGRKRLQQSLVLGGERRPVRQPVGAITRG